MVESIAAVPSQSDVDAKADDPHSSESHSSEVVHEGEDAAFGDTTHDSLNTDEASINGPLDAAAVSTEELNNGDISENQDANLVPVTDGNGDLQIIDVPNDALDSDSITINTQDDLTGGGTVELGGSVSIGENIDAEEIVREVGVVDHGSVSSGTITKSVSFSESYSDPPIVVTTLDTNDSRMFDTVRNVTTSGFDAVIRSDGSDSDVQQYYYAAPK